ncbi:MAG: response regulator [Acidimicrobiia bacterium]|nr:response regulator [Acidimicrobiia bacterium]MBV8296737.1 response regulator [Acidimicrobiia bacterium]MBV8305827.1 response regulator [Acidimicrobiia bacterium]MBV8560808.1 response regulator [Acidimicrobiia bacterium]
MAAGGNGNSARARVVLVDDEPDIVYLARTLFERDGRFDVVGEASDGEQAVRLAQRLRPEALLLDILMPGMDGWEALPLIRRVAPDTAVVVVSALGRRQDVAERATALGAAAYVEKAKLGSTPALVASVCPDC